MCTCMYLATNCLPALYGCCSFKKSGPWNELDAMLLQNLIFFLYIQISNRAVWRCFMRYAETETWTSLTSRLSNTRKHKFISLWQPCPMWAWVALHPFPNYTIKAELAFGDWPYFWWLHDRMRLKYDTNNAHLRLDSPSIEWIYRTNPCRIYLENHHW